MAADKTLVEGAYGVTKRQKVTTPQIDPESGEALSDALKKRKIDKAKRKKLEEELGRGVERGEDIASRTEYDERRLPVGEDDEEEITTTYDTWKKDNPNGTLEEWKKSIKKDKTPTSSTQTPPPGGLGFMSQVNEGQNSEMGVEMGVDLGDDIEVEKKSRRELRRERKQEKADNAERERLEKIYNDQGDNPGIGGYYEEAEVLIRDVKKKIPLDKLKNVGVKALNSISNGVQQFKALKERILKLNHGRRDQTGFTQGMTLKEDARFASFLNGDTSLAIEEVDGQMVLGFNEGGKFTSMGEVERDLDDNQVDVKSKASIIDIKQAQQEIVKNADAGTLMDVDNVRESITGIINEAKTLKSLVSDNMFGNTSFTEDLLNSDLNGMRYGDLGIDKAYDTDNDGFLTANDNLSRRDKKRIVKELTNNPEQVDTLKSILIEYFVSHIERNYNKAMAIKNKPQSNPPQANLTVGANPNEMTAQDYIDQQLDN